VLIREDYHPLEKSTGKVDRSGPYPVVRGVLLCGRESKAKRRYRDTAFEDLALYENKPGYSGHHKGPGNPDPDKRLCWYENVRRDELGLPRGDMGFNPKHPMTEKTLWEIENKPEFVKLSHVADVEYEKGADGKPKVSADGFLDVVKIHRIDSIDIVTNAGTTNTIFEDAPVAMTMKVWGKKVAPFLEIDDQIKLRELVKEEGMGDMPMIADAPGMEEDMTEDKGKDAVKSAFKTALMSALEKCMDNGSTPEDVKKAAATVKKYLMAHGSLCDEDMEEEEEVEVDKKPVEEGGKKKKPIGTVVTEEAPEVREGRALRECIAEEFVPTEAEMPLIRGIAEIKEKPDRIAAIRRLKGMSKATQPRSSSRETVREEAPKDPRDIHDANTPDAVAVIVKKIMMEGRPQPVAAK
jgi:hypothetical protein